MIIMFFLGIISVIIIRNYLSIFLEEKIMKNQKIFVGICLVCSILLETNSKIPFFNLLINFFCILLISFIGYKGKKQEKIKCLLLISIKIIFRTKY